MPRFELAVVRAAANEGRVESGGARYREKLLPLLRELSKMVAFAEAVLLELRPDDFIKTERYANGLEMDAYGIAISDALQERFGIEGFVTWYVKFTLDQDIDGNVVVMASLHGPDQPLKRVGGTIPVRFERRHS